jgi:hypothetical protein
VGAPVGDDGRADGDPSGGDPLDPGQGAQEGGLAGSGWAQQHEERAGVHL